uniref:Ribosomal protein L6 n=1 Tax=Glaucocystis incrassata TaxID=1789788 RepID=A0A3G1IVU8_9EUKA|nr:ribosomal protein L6 [Glaucocystis incrassata]ASQ40059.1 ribosomal protein L6 [Glaucocystis incrassata]
MSRIGKRLINIPDKVQIQFDNDYIIVTGPKGELRKKLPSSLKVIQNNETIHVVRANESLVARRLHGMFRTIISNLIEGVSKGFERRLEIQGVGYRAQIETGNLVLNIGFSHPVIINPPSNLEINVVNNNNIIVKGIDKELVGKIAAQIRSIRPPEPYKGKGIRYSEELVRRKVGKAGKK